MASPTNTRACTFVTWVSRLACAMILPIWVWPPRQSIRSMRLPSRSACETQREARHSACGRAQSVADSRDHGPWDRHFNWRQSCQPLRWPYRATGAMPASSCSEHKAARGRGPWPRRGGFGSLRAALRYSIKAKSLLMAPPVVRTVTALRRAVMQWRAAGERVALVPTMGALHAGHLALVRAARRRARRVVVSVFVNPAQFAPHEDFASYPRSWDTDLAALSAMGVDLVWA